MIEPTATAAVCRGTEVTVARVQLLIGLLTLLGCEQGIVLGRGLEQGPGDGGADARPGGELAFALANSYGAGAELAAVAIADMDGDGWPDLVAADAAMDRVVLLRGQGGGRFRDAEAVPTGGGPAAVALVDLNRDERMDLLSADARAGTVSVILRGEAGGFLTRTSLLAGRTPGALLTVDLDGDQWFDVAVADRASDEVIVFRNRGDGSGALAALPPVGVGGRAPVALAAGRLGWRPTPDLLSANRDSGDVSLLRGRGRGGLVLDGVRGLERDLRALALVDLGGDGVPELVAAGAVGTAAVLPGQGDGFVHEKFAERRALGAGAAALAVADFDGDGLPDLVSANAEAGSVSVLRGRRDGTIGEAQHFGAPVGAAALAAGDLDGDGLPDLAIAGRDGRLNVLLNRPR